MIESSWWYVLYVKANTEHKVVKDFERFVIASGTEFKFEPFVLESEKYYRDKKRREMGKSYLHRPMFPGYVFIETNMPSEEFLSFTNEFIRASENIRKVLRYGNSTRIAVLDEERRAIEYHFQGKRCLERSQGHIVGEEVIITSGPLVGREGSIKKINRHNRYALITMEFLGEKRIAEAPLEIVTKK